MATTPPETPIEEDRAIGPEGDRYRTGRDAEITETPPVGDDRHRVGRHGAGRPDDAGSEAGARGSRGRGGRGPEGGPGEEESRGGARAQQESEERESGAPPAPAKGPPYECPHNGYTEGAEPAPTRSSGRFEGRNRGGRIPVSNVQTGPDPDPETAPSTTSTTAGRTVDRPEPSGFIPDRVTVWGPQRDLLLRYLDGVDVTAGQLRLVAHVVERTASDPWTYAEGVPVYHELIEDLDDDRRRHSAAAVHEPLHLAGLLQHTRYTPPRGTSPGLSRVYSVHPDLVEMFAEAAPTSSSSLPPRVDLVTGRRVRTQPSTSLIRKNDNVIGSELYRRAIAVLERGVYHEPRVVAHLGDLERVRNAARDALEASGGHEYVPEVRARLGAAEGAVRGSGEMWSVQHVKDVVEAYATEHGEPRTEAFLAWRTARARFINDRSCFSAVLKQGPEPTAVPGVVRYRHNYQHQSSGRAGAVGGMFQSCTREMKEAAYAFIADVVNYDLVSSQPNFLVELLTEANGHPSSPTPPLDTDWIVRYVADRSSKTAFAERVGVSVDTWKTALCAVLMGGSVAHVVHESEGAIAEAFRADPACRTAGDLEAAWSRFQEAIAPLYDELRRWHVWIDTVYAVDDATSYPCRKGGHKGSRYVVNAAGEAYLWDPRTPPHQRKAQLAAHLLQGKEAAFTLHLIALGPAYGFEVVAHEHDGVVTLGEVPDEALERAKELSGVDRADLQTKSYT